MENPTASDKPNRTKLWRIWSIAATVLLAGAVGFVGWQYSRKSPALPAYGRTLNGPAPSAAAGKTFRIASYNIQSGKGLDGRFDLGRTAKNLQGVDVAGLNEVRGDGMLSDLAERLNLPWLFSPSERQFGKDYFGNGLLCRLPVLSWQRMMLPSPPGNDTFQSALLVRLKYQDRPVNLLIAHVTLRPYRETQLQALTDLFLSLSEPAILVGDMNSSQDDPVLSALLHTPGVTDATAPIGQGQGRRIDWIIARGLAVTDKGFIERGASDHPMVWADLSLPEK